jgi:acetyl esterase/lipase
MSSTSFLDRIFFYSQLVFAKAFVKLINRIEKFFNPLLPSQNPTFLKTYQTRPKLQHRIFIPPSHTPNGPLLPLYLSIHGGGFAICTPEFDDEFASNFAAKHNMIVVSLDYSKSPSNIFPMAMLDIVAAAQSVISDDSLPIDPSRIAIGGFSAGGCLAFAAAQADGLKDKLKAVVGWYPALDFTTKLSEKLKNRAYAYDGQSDSLESLVPKIEWGYLRDMSMKERHNSLVSPLYTPRDQLPEFVYLIGAEWDLLAPEARKMAGKLVEEKIGKDVYEFQAEGGRVRWEEVRGVQHGFTHNTHEKETVEVKAMREKVSQELYERVGSWLLQGAFNPNRS